MENVDIDCCNGEYKLSRWQQEECGIEFGRFPAYKKEKIDLKVATIRKISLKFIEALKN